MAGFRSADELFEAARELFARLEAGGHRQAAAELREGFACLNGLTDGWALFLEAIRRVEAGPARGFAPEDRKALERIRKAVDAAVHRR